MDRLWVAHKNRGLRMLGLSIDRKAEDASGHLAKKGHTFPAGLATPALARALPKPCRSLTGGNDNAAVGAHDGCHPSRRWNHATLQRTLDQALKRNGTAATGIALEQSGHESPGPALMVGVVGVPGEHPSLLQRSLDSQHGGQQAQAQAQPPRCDAACPGAG